MPWIEGRSSATGRRGRTPREALGLPAADRLRLYPLLQNLQELCERSLDDHAPAAIPQFRAAADAIGRASPDPELTLQAQRLSLNAEKAYLNHLARRDREKFLGDTARRFSETAAEAVEAISTTSQHRQRQLTVAVAGAITWSAVLTLLLWALSRRYIGHALSHIKAAIGSIRAGVYDYPVPAVPDDEVGDLTLFLRELSGASKRACSG